ncbi:MAG: HD domain-containing protein [Alphaproteobacteria bacterium]|nr:HD domain-containing protein [Alphaproteobacteria bacterium]
MYEELVEIVKNKLKSSSHDLSHTFRVYSNCIKIAQNEPNCVVDIDILQAAALLHDIARPEEDMAKDGKKVDHAILGAQQAQEILVNLGKTQQFSESVASAIKTHRFRGGLVPETMEAKILFDADKLDVIGNIGIARSYMIAGEQKQDIYNDCDINEYVKNNLVGGVPSGKIIDISKHTPNIEFATKNVNIPNKMFTQTGKELALARLKRMEEFFNILKQEIRGSM